jgi:hypothetical protein
MMTITPAPAPKITIQRSENVSGSEKNISYKALK